MHWRALLPLFALAGLGCKDLSRFDTQGTQAYCGAMVSSPLFQDGFMPAGVPPRLGMSLTLDTDSLSTRPGEISTDDADRGLCSAGGRPLIDRAPLRAIEELSHDALASLEFGEGREHNFLAWVDSTCQGTLLAIVSLMSDGKVEVRLLKPAALPPPDAPPDRKPGFALFVLERDEDGCGN